MKEERANDESTSDEIDKVAPSSSASSASESIRVDSSDSGEAGSSAGGLKLPSWYDSSFHDAAYAAVPGIGTGWKRWYDVPYRILSWLVRSWRRKLLPPVIRNYLFELYMRLIRYNEHDRNKARSLDDPMHNLIVPNHEHVAVPALWVVELFPPSAAEELETLVRKHTPQVLLYGREDEAVSLLSEIRAGKRWAWFGLGFIQAQQNQFIVPDSKRERLPDMFWGVELTAIQLGTGLTAVVAQFWLNDKGTRALDREWHKQHEPQLRRQGDHLFADDRKWSAFRHTQLERRRAHDAARNWMQKNCPGLFAQSREHQPLIDLLMVEKHAPRDGEPSDMEQSDAFRAIGLSMLHRVTMSPVVPGFSLSRVEPDLCPVLEPDRTWALWCNRTEAVASRPGLTKYGSSDELEALARDVDDDMRDIFLALSVTEMVHLMQGRYSDLRDTARRQHAGFSSTELQNLRETLLTLSIDLASSRVDVSSWWKRNRSRIPPFFIEYVRDEDDERTEELTELVRTRQEDELTQLGEADAAIRDILSTVASLGAAVDAFKIGRIALYVATLSLLVTALTLLLTNIGPESVAAHIGSWLRGLFMLAT